MTTKMTAAKPARAAVKKPALKKAAVPAKPTAKPAARATAKPVAKKPKKEAKQKVVRDSFTMPQNEYQRIAGIKALCLKSKMHVKKSEVLRAGLKLLGGLNDAELKRALSGLEKIKTGRPQKH